MDSKGIDHSESDWPKDGNLQDQEQIYQFRKKMEKDEIYLQSLSRLMKDLGMDLQQNNAIEIHQNYFPQKIEQEDDEPFRVRPVNLYRWNSNRDQMVNHILWQAYGQRKMGVSYGDIQFNSERMNTVESLVWDIDIWMFFF